MEPFFFKSVKGHLFGNYFPPSSGVADLGDLIFCPPFAEELNRSRHMIALQARTLNKLGYGVLLVDLYGTGDSEGTYGETEWETWHQDILAAINELTSRKRKFAGLWAMRTGALLAADVLQENAVECPLLILWQPVTTGRNFVGQFLRIKLAADLAGDTPASNTKDMMAALERGESQEIAGYDLTSSVAEGLGRVSLGKTSLPASTRLAWVEVSLKQDADISPASRKIIDKWSEDGLHCSTGAVQDMQFWALQEPEWAQDFVALTGKLAAEAGQ